ncbi:unnamed protein product [Protopolystoma xenopodis]|uniref:Uncharacterized protein n=1 Tax=Protopolystoma xenopodis TaxID=117903 RepID=A0A448XI85_9PLAT|nr:unnamed protein product [Protopolystoma xenopodis]
MTSLKLPTQARPDASDSQDDHRKNSSHNSVTTHLLESNLIIGRVLIRGICPFHSYPLEGKTTEHDCLYPSARLPSSEFLIDRTIRPISRHVRDFLTQQSEVKLPEWAILLPIFSVCASASASLELDPLQ